MKNLITSMVMVLGLNAGEPWSKADIAWESSCAITLLADWWQTRQLPGQYGRSVVIPGRRYFNEKGVYVVEPSYRRDITLEESNPILGRRPTKLTIDVYFISVFFLHVLAVELLPPEWRRVAQIMTIGVQLYVVHRNIQIEARVRF